jgi:iron complex transport system ATP-binding protein
LSESLFQLHDLGFTYARAPVLSQVRLSLRSGEMTAVAGPNGAGKSTLIGIMAGLRRGYSGQCVFRGTEVRQWPRRAFARQISFVPQSLQLEFPFTAEQVVLMGRTPYCRGLFESPDDWQAVERSMAMTDTLAFRARDFRSLSGGERQRVVLASALAQDPKVLLLDEPTTFLDLQHQISIYRLLREFCRQGLLVVAVTHDLNLAATYADRVVLLASGRVFADAAPAGVFTRASMRDVFGLDMDVRQGPGGRPWITYEA